MSEFLSIPQAVDFDAAEALARATNKLYGIKTYLARREADRYTEHGDDWYTLDTDFDGLEELEHMQRGFSAALQGAVDLMPDRAVIDRVKNFKTFANELVWDAMTHEQQATAVEIRRALASGPIRGIWHERR